MTNEKPRLTPDVTGNVIEPINFDVVNIALGFHVSHATNDNRTLRNALGLCAEESKEPS